jgi:Ca2+-binding RTX toxin-like protein
VISWQDGSRTGDDLLSDAVRAQVFDANGNKINSEFLVNNGVDGAQGAPVATVLAGGGFVIGWREDYFESEIAKIRFEGRVFALSPTDNSGNDILIGDSNTNLLDGGAGNDQIYGNGGNDDLRGGSGNDWIHVSGTGITVADGGGDFDVLEVNWGDSATAITMGYPNVDPSGGLTGSIGDGGARRVDYGRIYVLQITTGSGNDTLYSSGAGSSASMGGGDDRFWGAGGYETVDGGAGVDGVWAGLGLATTSIVWNLATNSFSGPIGSYTNIEYLLGGVMGSGNDTITTSSANLNDMFALGAGDDVATVVNGIDNVNGQSGNDLLIIDYSAATGNVMTSGTIFGIAIGSEGSGIMGQIGDGGTRRADFNNIDRFDVRTGSGNDYIVLGIGGLVTNDVVSLGGGDDFAVFGRGTDQGDGGSGIDGFGIDLAGATSAISVNLTTNSWSGPAGTSFTNFEYLGGMLGTSFQTGSGNDIVVTSAVERRDNLLLGAGNDSATVVNGFDAVDGQAGSDLLIIDYSAAAAGVTTSHGAGGIALGTDGSGLKGQISDGGTRWIDFDNIERLDVRTGSGNDNIVLGTGSRVSNDIVSLAGGDDFADFGRGVDQGDGGAGTDGLAADLSPASGAIGIDLLLNGWSGLGGSSFVNFEYLGSASSRFLTGSGNDSIVTGLGAFADFVSLGAGSDSATVLNGQDSVDGQSGSDLLIVDYSAATTAVTTTGGAPGISQGSDGSGSKGQIGDGGTRRVDFDNIERLDVRTGSGNDNIATGSGNDEIRTGAGADTLAGGGGDDLLDGGSGADSMAGGAGNDLYFVDNASDTVTEAAGEGADEVRTALAAYVLAADVETLTGTSATGQVLTGNSANNVVNAGAGNDVLHLWAGGGDDIVNAGAGNDNIFFGATLTAADVVNGGAGVDTLVVQGPYGSLTLTANITQIENVSILGGNNTNFGEPGTNRYDYVLTTNDANFAAGVQARINGAALLEGEDFTFNGSAETDASFVVYGGKGQDTLTGGLGNDIFFYAEERFASGDTVNGGAGYDGMFLRGNYTIDFNAPGYTGLFTNIENLTLTSATDERYARGGGTEFDYNLTLSDAIVGAGQELTVSGALLMVTETMVLDGSQETDGRLRLFGGKAADTLKGGAQADLLHGNLGADTLSGGGGADAFRYQAVTESYSVARDHITDFTPGTDKIELDRIDANVFAGGDQAFTWIGSNAFSNVAGQLRAFQSGAQWIVEGDINGDGYADLVIALTLQGPTPLGANDFLL